MVRDDPFIVANRGSSGSSLFIRNNGKVFLCVLSSCQVTVVGKKDFLAVAQFGRNASRVPERGQSIGCRCMPQPIFRERFHSYFGHQFASPMALDGSSMSDRRLSAFDVVPRDDGPGGLAAGN